MRLKEIMNCPVVSVSVNASISHVANVLDRHGYGFLPVVEHGKVLGVVTGRDIATRATARWLSFDSTPISTIMTKPAITLKPEHEAEVALAVMREKGIRRLLVAEDNGELLGVVCLSDLAGYTSDQSIAETLQRHAEHSSAHSHSSVLCVPGLFLG